MQESWEGHDGGAARWEEHWNNTQKRTPYFSYFPPPPIWCCPNQAWETTLPKTYRLGRGNLFERCYTMVLVPASLHLGPCCEPIFRWMIVWNPLYFAAFPMPTHARYYGTVYGTIRTKLPATQYERDISTIMYRTIPNILPTNHCQNFGSCSC